MKRITDFFTLLAQNYLPSAYVFSLILTTVVFAVGVVVIGESPLAMITYWGDGFWSLMTFSMQMSLILIGGFTLAKTKIISVVLSRLANLSSSNTSAVILVTLVSSAACYLSWGFGLIVSALFAIEVAKRVRKVNFGLLIAASYSGFLVWHGGLSGSIPLKLTNPSGQMQKIIEVSSISLDQTIFSAMNLTILFFTVLTILIVNFLFSKDQSRCGEDFNFSNNEDSFCDNNQTKSFASKLDNSYLITFFIGIMGGIYIVHKLSISTMTFNLMIFIFLILGMCLHKTPRQYLFHFQDSVKQSAGIILQFPFYAGIMGMMSSSGMAKLTSEFFISISTPDTFLISTYLSAGLVNFFVPSGGGQWAIQGPIILPAAKQMGVDLAKASMAIAWGDAWSNMVQPFWALPLLSIAKLELKEIMAYLVIIFLSVGLITSGILYLY